MIERIPIAKVRPYDGQPRKYFDEESLGELAASIKENGQTTPAWVVPVGGGLFELIAGERRWRACALAGVETLLCEVRDGLTEGQRYLASVMENFGRKDCTTMETARSVGEVLRMNGGDLAKTASVFAKGVPWVRQYNSLLKLDPLVAQMLEPPAPSLSLVGASSLAGLRAEVQVRIAKELVQAGLKHRAALRHIRASVEGVDRATNLGRPRKPSDDFELVQRLLIQLGPDTDAVLGMEEDRLKAMFGKKSAAQLAGIYGLLAKRRSQFGTIMERFEKFVTRDGRGM